MARQSPTRRKFLLETSQAVYEKGAMRQIVVEAQDSYAVLRLRGLKSSFALPWGTIYHLAAAKAAERDLRQRRAELGL